MRKFIGSLILLLILLLAGCEQQTNISITPGSDKIWTVTCNITIEASSRAEALSKIAILFEAESKAREDPPLTTPLLEKPEKKETKQ